VSRALVDHLILETKPYVYLYTIG